MARYPFARLQKFLFPENMRLRRLLIESVAIATAGKRTGNLGKTSMFIQTNRLSRAAAAGIALVLIGGAAQADTLVSDFSFSVVQPTQDGGEELVARDSVRPGEVIQYQIRHENGTDEDLSGLVVQAPVPQGVTLTLDGQTSSVPAVFEVQAELDPELDGLEWSTLPAVRKVLGEDGELHEEPLPESDIAAVRWTLSEPLEADGIALNTYRVRVN